MGASAPVKLNSNEGKPKRCPEEGSVYMVPLSLASIPATKHSQETQDAVIETFDTCSEERGSTFTKWMRTNSSRFQVPTGCL